MLKTWKHKHISSSKQNQLMKEYENKYPHQVKINNHSIRFKLGTDNINSQYSFQPTVKTIGYWKHTNKNQILIDKDVKKKNLKPLLVHEATEQYLQKQKGLTYWKAHQLATQIEKDYVHDKKKNWKSYQNSVLRTKT